MMNTDNRSSETADLHHQPEEIALENTAQTPEDTNSLFPEQVRRLLNELQVHQIELEMQNEELRRTQNELDAARTRYFDLHDLAPVGYVTVSENGRILESNLTAAALLGVTRGALFNSFMQDSFSQMTRISSTCIANDSSRLPKRKPLYFGCGKKMVRYLGRIWQ